MRETSIIIRTRNEEKWIGAVLTKLTEQDYQNFEIIIVDSGSKDRTLEIAQRFPVKIISIPKDEFTYPHALNIGAQNSSATKYLAILSAHSIPYSEHWLGGSIEVLSNIPNAAGIYGYLLPLPSSTFWDWLFYRGWIPRSDIFHRRKIFNKDGPGVLGFTNAVIRKDLWNRHHFDENYALGGEDGEWVKYWTVRNYCVIKDWICSVRHSHNLDLFGWWQQRKYWISLGSPHPFRYQKYRKDGPHSE